MNTWYEYREVWSRHPWVLIMAVVAVALVIAGVVGTIGENRLAFFFIPGLGALYGHHLIVTKKAE